MLLVAAAVLAVEALGLLAYTAHNVVDILTGNRYGVADSVGQDIIQVIVIAGLVWFASGVRRVRPWTRTPAVMAQVLAGIIGIILIQGHQDAWGWPTLALAVAGLVGLLTRASRNALARPIPQPEPPPEKPSKRSGNPAKRSPGARSATRRS